MNETATTSSATMTVGLDVGDRKTHFCLMEDDEIKGRGSFETTQRGLAEALREFSGARVALEAGSQSPWMSRALKAAGFECHVVDPRRVQLISKDPRKTDRRDAEVLAMLEAGVPQLLGSIHHRGEQAQADMALLRARVQLVGARTSLIQCVRGLVKAHGERLPSTAAKCFDSRVRPLIPEALIPALGPLLDQIESFTVTIRAYDRQIATLEERYPEVQVLQQVQGVGPLTSTAYALTIEDPERFKDSRSVGSFVGLCPRSHASGDSDPELRISKSGDGYLRGLLVQCAQYILGPFGQPSDLRAFGARLAERGGRAAKKRAIIAVARKLAVLLHRLWRHDLKYDPHHEENRKAALAAG